MSIKAICRSEVEVGRDGFFSVLASEEAVRWAPSVAPLAQTARCLLLHRDGESRMGHKAIVESSDLLVGDLLFHEDAFYDVWFLGEVVEIHFSAQPPVGIGRQGE